MLEKFKFLSARYDKVDFRKKKRRFFDLYETHT